MQTKLNNSDLILLLPKGYKRVANGAELYEEMYRGRKFCDVQMFQNLAASSCGNIVISHIDPSDAMKFGDKDALIAEIHGSLEENQGLIEVGTGTNPRGYEYIYYIVKTYHQEKFNVNYCLRMDIKNGDEHIEVSASFFEQFMTGERTSFAWAMAKDAGIEDDLETHSPVGWLQDPYDPEYNKGCLMNMGERAGFDRLFPGDPLSQARGLILALTKDSYYKTPDEIEAESEQKSKGGQRSRRRAKRDDPDSIEGIQGDQKDEYQEDGKALLQRMFSDDAQRAGEYKVDIAGEEDSPEPKLDAPRKKLFFKPSDIAKAAAKTAEDFRSTVAKTSAELDKVRTPFEIPDDFRGKLNKPIREIPGWGKRHYIGFGKNTYGMNALLITWPVTEKESMPLTDTNAVINIGRSQVAANQGLIDAKCGVTPKGNRYAYIIRKAYRTDEDGNKEWPVQYLLALNMRINGKIHFIDSSFGPNEELGDIRKNVLRIMSCGSRDLKLTADEWERDPFDPESTEEFLMDWTEDEKYDALFPYSPLAELRGFLRYVVENN